MSFRTIERTIVDFFESNGADVDQGDTEFYLDGLSLVDTDISLSALAVAINDALKTDLRGSDE